MGYQKIANLLDDNKSNQPSKFRTKNWVEINDEYIMMNIYEHIMLILKLSLKLQC